jgi:DNA invertase Pin-like site-specific DNA recombinase
MKYGYARVSTDDQSTALQVAALKRAGCKALFKDETLSGATTKRPALLRCLKALEDGDTLIVWKLVQLNPIPNPRTIDAGGVCRCLRVIGSSTIHL